MKAFPCLLCVVLIASGLLAQQLEVNTIGGKLTSHGAAPVVGQPFLVEIASSIALEVGGGPGRPYLLGLGSLATTSVPIPALGGQFFDLTPAGFTVIGSGFGGPALLPSGFFVTNPFGTSAWVFPVNAAQDGQRFACQAVVLDPSLPSALNITAAAEFSVTNNVVLTGTEDVRAFNIPSGSYTFYGNSWSSLEVSTNGWVRFGSQAPGVLVPDPSAGVAKMTMGIMGDPLPPIPGFPAIVPAAPGVAVFWDQLDFSAGLVTVSETSPGLTTIVWSGGMHVPTGTNLGTFSCQIDDLQGAIFCDYSAFVAPPGINTGTPAIGVPAQSPIVGVTSGPVVGVVASIDLVAGGSINTFVATGPIQTIFQDFAGSAPPPAAEVVDLAGQFLTFLDSSSARTGAFSLF